MITPRLRRTLAKHAPEIKRLFRKGLSKREIARRLKISRASVLSSCVQRARSTRDPRRRAVAGFRQTL